MMARLMFHRSALIFAAWMLLSIGLAGGVRADSILAVVWGQYSGGAYTNLRSALIEGGHTVTQLGPPAPGQIATALTSGSYDQVFVYDVASALYLTNQADKDALRNWYRDRNYSGSPS